MTRRNSALVTIYVPYYKDDTLIPIMKKYIQENLIPSGSTKISFDMPNVVHNQTIPEHLESDLIQQCLLPVVVRNYQEQQIHLKAKYQIMGKKHREHMTKLADERQKQLIVGPTLSLSLNCSSTDFPSVCLSVCLSLKAKRLEEDRLRIQEEKDIANRLKGLVGQELSEAKEIIFKQRQTRILEVKPSLPHLPHSLCFPLCLDLSLSLSLEWH
jgi:hypothetical protein